METLINAIPKAELHLHIEGSLSPALLLKLADKNKVALPYKTLEEVESAYQFEDLQSFLDIYYFGASVLIEEDDFYQLMWQYLCHCKENNIVHCEVMFDPQTHTQRGIGFDVFMPGFIRAIEQAKQEWGQSTLLIMSFLRHLSEESAFETLEQSRPYLSDVTAVGLDSSESGNPPEKFARVFKACRDMGLELVAHAGEEGPPEYIWSALEDLHVSRIDHGVRCVEDAELVNYLNVNQVPLTVCPVSNVKLKVFSEMSEHNILTLLEQGLIVTVNSDDPTYFGGFLTDNYAVLSEQLDMTTSQLVQLVKNSFNASFLPDKKKRQFIRQVEQVVTRVARQR